MRRGGGGGSGVGLLFILLSCCNTIIKMTDSFKQHLKPIGVKTNERRLKTNSGVSLGMHRCLESGLNEERRGGWSVCVCV